MKVQQSYRIDLELAQALQAMKEKTGNSLNSLVNDALRGFLNGNVPPKEAEKKETDSGQESGQTGLDMKDFNLSLGEDDANSI